MYCTAEHPMSVWDLGPYTHHLYSSYTYVHTAPLPTMLTVAHCTEG